MAGPLKAKRGRLLHCMLAVAWAVLLFQPIRPCAQTAAQDQSPKRSSAPPTQRSKPATDNATQKAPDQPMWDPLRAEKDIEVGRFYMRKGDLDAAMDRFQDAILAKPGFAIPFLYLGEAQEKKRLKKQALLSYRRYLDLVPHADDAQKIRKKIERLQEEVNKEKN